MNMLGAGLGIGKYHQEFFQIDFNKTLNWGQIDRFNLHKFIFQDRVDWNRKICNRLPIMISIKINGKKVWD